MSARRRRGLAADSVARLRTTRGIVANPRTLTVMGEFAQCLHEYHLTDCPFELLDGWREDAERDLMWLTDVHGFNLDGTVRDLVGDEDPALAQVLADCRRLLTAQGWAARRAYVPLYGPPV